MELFLYLAIVIFFISQAESKARYIYPRSNSGRIFSRQELLILKATLAAKNIRMKSIGNCDNPERQDCTSFVGIHRMCYNELIRLKDRSPCTEIIVVGGTEIGHESFDAAEESIPQYNHQNGWKIDLEKSECLNNFIIGRYGTFDGLVFSSNGPFSYHDHGSHWDLQCTPFPL